MKMKWDTAVLFCAFIVLTGALIVAGVVTPGSREARRLVKPDGSVPLVWKAIQKHLLDPQNAHANEWKVKGDESLMIVEVDITAPNALGGMARNEWSATVDPQTAQVMSIHDSKGRLIEGSDEQMLGEILYEQGVKMFTDAGLKVDTSGRPKEMVVMRTALSARLTPTDRLRIILAGAEGLLDARTTIKLVDAHGYPLTL